MIYNNNTKRTYYSVYMYLYTNVLSYKESLKGFVVTAQFLLHPTLKSLFIFVPYFEMTDC